jgi:hypothetical protein
MNIDQVSVAYVLLAISVAIAYSLLRKPAHVKKQLREMDKNISDIPAQLPPAVVGALIRKMIFSQSEVTATLFDLAERGYLRLKWKQHEQKGPIKLFEKITLLVQRTSMPPSNTLRIWETSLLEWIETRITPANSFGGFTSIRNIFPGLGEGALDSTRWFEQWKTDLGLDMHNTGWFRSNKRAAWTAVVVQSIVVLIAWRLNIPEAFGIMFLISIVGFFSITVGLLNMHTYTDKGWQAQVIWNAYRKSLKNGKIRFTQEEQFRRHLIYAVGMDLGGRAMKRLADSARGLTVPPRIDEDWILLEADDGTSRAEQFYRAVRLCRSVIGGSVNKKSE